VRYLTILKNNMPGSRKRQRRATGNEDINQWCWDWFQEATGRRINISTRYCTFVVNKHFSIACYVCLLFCSCGHVTELTLVYIYCWWIYLKLIACVFGNSKFVVPSTLTIDLGFASVNSQCLGDNKLAIPSTQSISILLWKTLDS
jgi:hypothetical protein